MLLLEGERSRLHTNGRVFNQDYTVEEAEKWGVSRPVLTKEEENLIYNRMKVVFWEYLPEFSKESVDAGLITEEMLHLKPLVLPK